MGAEEKELISQKFLDLIQRSRRGKFKLYIGMIAGVGKTYRMLKETRSLLQNGVDVKIGYIESHNRKDVERLMEDLPIIPRKKIFYKGKELEEMDMQAIINIHPDIVIIDELAHSNIPGSKNEKRWQDIIEILSAGINVISAVNIQHIESLYNEIHDITGIEVHERIPDHILTTADEIVNIDLSADDLIERLKEGKIYNLDKVEIALNNFFRPEKILQLRELALKEVAGQVERKITSEVFTSDKRKPEKFLACISTNNKTAKKLIRKTARLASYYTSSWIVLYVQIPSEEYDKINLEKQRLLLNNLKLATELGAEILKVKGNNIAENIVKIAMEKDITTVLMGLPSYSFMKMITRGNILKKVLKRITGTKIDIIIVS
ncbi:MAG: sensor protein KdpD [Bacteroidota bacterium]|nr:sensor protein KdpD [Bacteroidota bacterium]